MKVRIWEGYIPKRLIGKPVTQYVDENGHVFFLTADEFDDISSERGWELVTSDKTLGDWLMGGKK